MPKLTELLGSKASFDASVQKIVKARPANVVTHNPGLKSAEEIDRWMTLPGCNEEQRTAHRAELAGKIKAAQDQED